MAIVYRPARQDDLTPACEVMYQAMNDLEHRHGFEGPVAVATPEFHAFCLDDDPECIWVAEDAGRIIGISFSWVSGALWFLADLFVLPQYQGRGVGDTLLQRTLDQARKHEVDNRALITFSFNRASIGLYVKHGLFPRQPIYVVSAPRARLAGRPATHDLAWTPIDGDRAYAATLRQIDEAALGVVRDLHHRYLRSEPAVKGFLLEQGGKPAGYVYISHDGHIGPLAVAAREAFAPAFETALSLAMAGGAEQVSAFLPGSNGDAMSIARRHGMRLGRTMVLLSEKEFGDWAKYAPNHPGFM